jgi:hypothetical protein
MGAAFTILMGILDLLPKLTRTAQTIKDELQRSGEMTPTQTAEMNAKWELAFAADHWKPEVK